MSTVISVEPYDQVVDDIRPLLVEHHAELAMFKNEIPLDPDYAAYEAGCAAGLLRIYTVRLGGALIGYAIFAVQPRHTHYAHRWAINDILWLHPAHRKFGIGTELCDFYEEDLRRGGPIVIHIETKEWAPELAMLLRSRGYVNVGLSLAKRIA